MHEIAYTFVKDAKSNDLNPTVLNFVATNFYERNHLISYKYSQENTLTT